MKRRTKQRLWYEISRAACMASVIGVLSAVGRMEWGEISTGRGFLLAAACLLTAALSGRLAGAIDTQMHCESHRGGQAKKEAA